MVAGYLQSLEWAPCATIKLDAQDNHYIGSMLHSSADLRRCEMPGSGRERPSSGPGACSSACSITRWRVNGFTPASSSSPPTGLWHITASGGRRCSGSTKTTHFSRPGAASPEAVPPECRRPQHLSAMYRGQIVGLLELTQGTHRQLTSPQAWRSVLPLSTISNRGRVSFWVPCGATKTSAYR